ncbi:diaminopimelate decarboxylase, partial [bacterium]|nr:diaminopimelate decarboxylase [bacterium]
FITGNAGVLLTKVLLVKKSIEKKFIIVDAAMNDLARPSLYDAYHNILPLVKSDEDKSSEIVDIVGPVCESGDFFAKNRRFPFVESNNILAILSAGAYGFSMSSNYNSRPRAAEVLAKNGRCYLIRKRETYRDLIRNEKIPAILAKLGRKNGKK